MEAATCAPTAAQIRAAANMRNAKLYIICGNHYIFDYIRDRISPELYDRKNIFYTRRIQDIVGLYGVDYVVDYDGLNYLDSWKSDGIFTAINYLKWNKLDLQQLIGEEK